MEERGLDPRPAYQAQVPAWLDHLAAVGWRILAVAAMAWVLALIAIAVRDVSASLVIGGIVSAALVPTARGLRARGLSPTIASAVSCVIGLAVLIVVLLAIIVLLVPSLTDIVAAVREGVADLREALVSMGLPATVIDAFDRFVEAIAGLLTGNVGALVGSIAGVATVFVLAGFLTFFLLTDGDRGWTWLMRPLDAWRADAVTRAASDGLDHLGGYLRRTALLAVVDAVVMAGVLGILGVPLAGPLVVLVFLGGFVPYLGAIVTTLIVALVALATGGMLAAAVVVVAVAATSIVAGRLLERTPLGSAVDVAPLLPIVAIPAGAALFGSLGLFALLPLMVLVLAVVRSITLALGLGPTDRDAPRYLANGVPVWLDRLGQWSWRGLIVAGLLWLIIQIVIALPGVVLPAVLATIVAATIAPIVPRLQAAGLTRGWAAAATTAGAAIVVVVSLLATVVWTVGPLRELVGTAGDGGDETGIDWISDIVDALGSGLVADVAGLLRSFLVLGLVLTVALLMTFFFLRDGSALWGRAMRELRGTRRDRIELVGHNAVDVLSSYMVGTTIISLFGGVTSWLVMVILGLPLAIPVGLFTFFGGYIPYIGSFLSTALAFLIAVAVGTTSDIIWMGIFTIVFNILQGSFVAPIVYGRSLSLHPAVVLLAIPAGGAIAGILGMFLVVPAVAIVASTWRATLEAIAAGQTDGVEPGASASPGSPTMLAGAEAAPT